MNAPIPTPTTASPAPNAIAPQRRQGPLGLLMTWLGDTSGRLLNKVCLYGLLLVFAVTAWKAVMVFEQHMQTERVLATLAIEEHKLRVQLLQQQLEASTRSTRGAQPSAAATQPSATPGQAGPVGGP